VVFVHDGDRCLCCGSTWPGSGPAPHKRLTSPGRALLCRRPDRQPLRRRWIGVMEANGRDLLVAVPLAGGEPQQLHPAADFCGYACHQP
jgi:hypothetical protein